MGDRIGLICVAVAIVLAAIIMACALRYGPIGTNGVIDHWTGASHF